MKKPRALVLLSGGLDSAVCLAQAVKNLGAENVVALNTHYGQKHAKEVECAKDIAKHYGVECLEMDLTKVMEYSNCSLLEKSSAEIPEGEYSDQKKEDGAAVSTFVPFRNGVLASVAVAVAYSVGADEVVLGIHRDDAAGAAYPDCTDEFYYYMQKAVRSGTGEKVGLYAPFASRTKADIVAEGIRLGVPFEKTWSCYKGGEKPCGKCGTCIDREKAFRANGMTDPLTGE